ncbi:hypothetical protein DFH07DRAFT_963655 [Mycena maculata]|uniref:Ribonuclease H1 N-terminal domain-containing protein n=1 Tax=Mycena maculata TaxID=230809 RepID=A0AAD7ILD2_9AGAR|nr:hypothetical protein DFH07DRAFT_963655 [Mycena maculata]
MLAAQRLARDNPPEYPDEIDDLVRHFEVSSLIEAHTTTPPPSSPKLPATPIEERTAKSKSVPSTPVGRDNRAYAVRSPEKNGGATIHTVQWFSAGTLTQEVSGASVRRVGGSKKRKPASAAYIVFYGGEVGVFEQWTDVQTSIHGHGLAIFSGFPTVAAADAALAYARGRGWTADSQAPTSAASPFPLPSYKDNPLNVGAGGSGVWYTVCRGGSPGVYRSYLECGLNISGIKGSLFASFDSREEAEAAFHKAREGGLLRSIPRVTAI